MTKHLKQLDDKDIHIGCLNCSTVHRKAPLNMDVTVGFGFAQVTKDGKEVWSSSSMDEVVRLRRFEMRARKEPDADWRLVRVTALHDEEYQRQGRNNWVIVKSGLGIA